MKGKLVFDLPEENEEFRTACDAGKYFSFLHSFQEWLIKKYKHQDPQSDDSYQEYQDILEHYITMRGDYEINF